MVKVAVLELPAEGLLMDQWLANDEVSPLPFVFMNSVGAVAIDSADSAVVTSSALLGSENTSSQLPGPEAISPVDYYVARVGWWPDSTVMIQVQDRRQKILQVRAGYVCMFVFHIVIHLYVIY